MPGEAAKHESRDSKINLKIFFDFWIAAVVFPGYREKTMRRQIPAIIRSH